MALACFANWLCKMWMRFWWKNPISVPAPVPPRRASFTAGCATSRTANFAWSRNPCGSETACSERSALCAASPHHHSDFQLDRRPVFRPGEVPWPQGPPSDRAPCRSKSGCPCTTSSQEINRFCPLITSTLVAPPWPHAPSFTEISSARQPITMPGSAIPNGSVWNSFWTPRDQCPDVRALNYVGLEGAKGDTVVLKDESFVAESLEVKPSIVVNASGAWIDFTNRALGAQTQYIGGTKGSHIVLDHPELLAATRGQMLYFANADGRICIFYPFYGKVIAGSTDIPVSDPETALCDEGEVDYILESMRRVFPAIDVDRSHIVYRFCGVRPLPRSDSTTRERSVEIIVAPLSRREMRLTFRFIP